MPICIAPGLSIHDFPHRVTRFRTIKVGQIFWYNREWWIKHGANGQWARRADTKENISRRFKGTAMVRIIRALPLPDTELDQEILSAANLGR